MIFFAQRKGGLISCFFSGMTIPAFAQYIPTETFKPIVYPPGDEYRTSAGTPGTKYWIFHYPSTSPVLSVIIDPAKLLPDTNRQNNVII